MKVKPRQKWVYCGEYYRGTSRNAIVTGVGRGSTYAGGSVSPMVWFSWTDVCGGEECWYTGDFLRNFQLHDPEAKPREVCVENAKLRARIKKLELECGSCRNRPAVHGATIAELEAERDELRQENKKLTELIESLRDLICKEIISRAKGGHNGTDA